MHSSTPRRAPVDRARRRAAVAAVAAVVVLLSAACADPIIEPDTARSGAQSQVGEPDGADAEHRPAPPAPQVGDAGSGDTEAGDAGSGDTDPGEAGPTGPGPTGPGPTGPGSADPDDLAGSQPGAGPQNRLPDELLGLTDDCSPEIAAAVVTTIGSQLDDFAQGDFSAALSHATSAFQASTDADAFQRLIEVGYPMLLQDATAELALCTRRGPDTVEVGVEVTTADRVSAPFAYRLRLDRGRWAIDGAVRLTPPPAAT